MESTRCWSSHPRPVFSCWIAVTPCAGIPAERQCSRRRYPERLGRFFQVDAGAYQPVSFRHPGVVETDGGTELTALATTDVDGDGDLDLVSANDGNFYEALALFRLDEQRTFVFGPVLTGGQNGYRSVSPVDFDRDGDFDLVAGASNGNPEIFTQLAPGRFSSASLLLNPQGGAVVKAMDLDGDGGIDIVDANGAVLWGP